MRAARALRRWLAAEVERFNEAHAETGAAGEGEEGGGERGGGDLASPSFSREHFVARASASARKVLGAVFGALAAQDGESVAL